MMMNKYLDTTYYIVQQVGILNIVYVILLYGCIILYNLFVFLALQPTVVLRCVIPVVLSNNKKKLLVHMYIVKNTTIFLIVRLLLLRYNYMFRLACRYSLS